MNIYRTILIMLFSLLILVGCSNEPIHEAEKNIAYISVTENSQYAATFQDLHLGVLYDFHLKLTEADKSWVTLWVEGYKNGEEANPIRLAELSYGMHPDATAEGPLGFGMINSASEEALFFLYSPGASTTPQSVEHILNPDGVDAATWGYAIGDEETGLKSGETKVSGVYRLTGNMIKTYDYQNADNIRRMIEEDISVLLLKIKVEKMN